MTRSFFSKTPLGIIVFGLFLFVAGLVGCSDATGPTWDEVRDFEFSANIQSSPTTPGSLMASHELGDTLSPYEFVWLGDETLSNRAPAHSIGVFNGFIGLVPGETFVYEFSVLWVNGVTEKPLSFSPMVATSIHYYSGSEIELPSVPINGPYELKQIGPHRYRVEFVLPLASGWYNMELISGVTLGCVAEGRKSFVLKDVSISGGGFMVPISMPGQVLVNTECRGDVPQYSVLGG